MILIKNMGVSLHTGKTITQQETTSPVMLNINIIKKPVLLIVESKIG